MYYYNRLRLDSALEGREGSFYFPEIVLNDLNPYTALKDFNYYLGLDFYESFSYKYWNVTSLYKDYDSGGYSLHLFKYCFDRCMESDFLIKNADSFDRPPDYLIRVGPDDYLPIYLGLLEDV